MNSNLPPTEYKSFYDRSYSNTVTFPANEIDGVMGFFLKRGFDETSSRTITIILLNQAKLDSVNVFALLDTLKTTTDVQLSNIVTQILNATREKTSMLGYRIAPVIDTYESRNILI